MVLLFMIPTEPLFLIELPCLVQSGFEIRLPTGLNAIRNHHRLGIRQASLGGGHFHLLATDLLLAAEGSPALRRHLAIEHRLGASERAIRDSFRQAYDEGAILFLDEFENLVQQRREGNNASIIEMTTTTILAELDRYRGLFVACTLISRNIVARIRINRFVE